MDIFEKIKAFIGASDLLGRFTSLQIGLGVAFLCIVILLISQNRTKKDKEGNEKPKKPMGKFEALYALMAILLVVFGVMYLFGDAQEVREQHVEQKLYNKRLPAYFKATPVQWIEREVGGAKFRFPVVKTRRITITPSQALVELMAEAYKESKGKADRCYCEIGLRMSSAIIFDYVWDPEANHPKVAPYEAYTSLLDGGEIPIQPFEGWLQDQLNAYEAWFSSRLLLEEILGAEIMYEIYGVSGIQIPEDVYTFSCYIPKPYDHPTDAHLEGTARDPRMNRQQFNPYRQSAFDVIPGSVFGTRDRYPDWKPEGQ